MSRWVYILSVGFGSGVAVRSFFDFGVPFAGLFLLLGLLFLILSNHAIHRMIGTKIPVEDSDEKHFSFDTRLLGLALLFIFMGLGVLRMDSADTPRPTSLDQYREERVSFRGLVVEEPDVRDSFIQLVVDTEAVKGVDEEVGVLVRTNSGTRYRYGDTIAGTGVLSLPKSFETETGRVFHYAQFLEKDDIFYILSFADTEIIESGGGNPIRRVLFSTKELFLESIGRILPEPEVSLLGGLVVGAKESLGERLLDAFRITGVIHIVVLSGYNVTIVAEAIMRMLSFVPLMGRLVVGGVAITLFALLTGASATIVRASLMAILVLIARASGRVYDITRALFLVGFLMVLHNPHILLFDPSFQLSFLATLGLLWVAPHIERVLFVVPSKWQVREFVTATIATQLFVLPLLLYMTGELSVVSVLTNVLVLGAVPATMLVGFLAGVAGLVSTLLALPIAFIAFLLLHYQLLVVELLASLPFASVSIEAWPFIFVILLYGFYGLAILYLKKSH